MDHGGANLYGDGNIGEAKWRLRRQKVKALLESSVNPTL
jgi:hypothetical protein